MSTPFIGEIRIFGGNFAPLGWAFCSGQTLSISQNDALFTLVGTTYGGDGVNTFNLPDLQGRVPVHQGQGPGLSNYIIGQMSGVETVMLATQQIPAHTHTALGGAGTGASNAPAGNAWAPQAAAKQYLPVNANNPPAIAPMGPSAIGANSGGLAHDNMLPFLALNFIIAMQGIFPSQ